MDVVLQLRGSNNATVKDVVDLRKLLKKSVFDMKSQMQLLLQHFEISARTPSKCNQTPGVLKSANGAGDTKNNLKANMPSIYNSNSLEVMRHLPEPISLEAFDSKSLL